ncbi:MAG: hypothetical protein GXY84_04655 [Clostridiales bacterium]|nr:hypothetical protein [Clostridiales bacterium]
MGEYKQAGYKVYKNSVQQVEGHTICMAQTDKGDRLLVLGESLGFEGNAFEYEGRPCLLAELSHHNAKRLRAVLPFTAPRPGLSGTCSIGVGDRLGLATPGHLRAFRRHPGVFPVLAQQSIRELNLTGRSYGQVLDCASWAVFREGWTEGWGADGDHLKKHEEIQYALDCGFSMITLDCSEHIRNQAAYMNEAELETAYIPDTALESLYADKIFTLEGGINLRFDRAELARCQLVYGEAINFMKEVHERFIRGRTGDFEISIDETSTPTTPTQHFFVANELTRAGVRFQSMAPRFCGEFQKGIDYIGDIQQFDAEMKQHAAIAQHFGYKVSLHSGSDKFSVFPSVGRITHGVFHLKTAGTNWLEAVRLAAMKDRALYRRVHAFALSSYEAASAYYHVNGRPEQLPDITQMADSDLPALMDRDDARQVLHITYGLILTAKKEDGGSLLRDELYRFWEKYKEDYARLLDRHIGRHLDLLLAGKQME